MKLRDPILFEVLVVVDEPSEGAAPCSVRFEARVTHHPYPGNHVMPPEPLEFEVTRTRIRIAGDPYVVVGPELAAVLADAYDGMIYEAAEAAYDNYGAELFGQEDE